MVVECLLGVALDRETRPVAPTFVCMHYGITDRICPLHIVDAISSAMPNSVQSIKNVGATGRVARSNKGMPIDFLLNPYSDLVLSELVNSVLFDALPQKHQVKCHKNTK